MYQTADKIGTELFANQYVNICHNIDITHTDAEGFTQLVLRCSCTITAGISVSYNISVEDEEVYTANKDTIDKKVLEYKQQVQELASKHNAPFI